MRAKTLSNGNIFLWAIVCFLGCMSFPAFLWPAQNQWTEIYPRDEKCSISFPGKPSFMRQSIKVAEGKDLNYDVYLMPFDNKGVFMFLIATYPVAISDQHQTAGLEGLLRGLVGRHPDNQLIFASLSEHVGHPSMNFLIHSVSNYLRGHAIMAGNKLFLIAMEGKKDGIDEKVFDRFVKSFQLNGITSG